MSSTVMVIPIFLLFLFFALVVPVLVGVYVYRDAKARGMDAVLWTIIAVLAPSLIGLIVYLVVRSSNNTRRCAQCGAQVSAEFASCPYCGAQLRNCCPNCKQAVEAGWRNCPHCGVQLPEMQELYTQPPKNKLPVWLLAVIIAVPVLILLMFLGLAIFSFARF